MSQTTRKSFFFFIQNGEYKCEREWEGPQGSECGKALVCESTIVLD